MTSANLPSDEIKKRLEHFIDYATNKCVGDEKGEAHVFCERFFQAFGHTGYKEAGAVLEARVHRKDKSVQYADLLWAPRLLLEMKKRGEKLERHYQQVFEYWIQLVPHRPKYVIVCNSDEFWIYDFNNQLDDPVDKISIHDLVKRRTALNFMLIDEQQPKFHNNRVSVTREAAENVALAFNSMITRGENREQAQRYILQCVVALFSEDIELLPQDRFSLLLDECPKGKNSYDLIGGLFRQMNLKKQANAGHYKDVPYFNGGLFESVDPIELTPDEHQLLVWAADQDWSMVQPPIFGTLFEQSMGKGPRHAAGAHFTSEAEIKRVLLPSLETPWRERIEKTSKIGELKKILVDLSKLRVLDPACGSGNFLYVAYRIMKRLEAEVIAKIYEEHRRHASTIGTLSRISPHQFFGIDNNAFAVDLAKVTLMVAKKLALDEVYKLIEVQQQAIETENALPLDNLDKNIWCADALLTPWPEADVIVGNPPYQSKNKAQQEYGRTYMNQVREAFPDVPGRADYCVYWFRKAHDHLSVNGRAGLVGTNTIRQNFSRVGGLEYICSNNGTIVEAVSSQVWPGEAVVHVSIVNWLKGKQPGKKKLFTQHGDRLDSPWTVTELDTIGPSLSADTEVSSAEKLLANTDANVCYQGQTQGHKGFLLSKEEAKAAIAANQKNAQVIFPYLIGDDILDEIPPTASRYIIDFCPLDVIAAAAFDMPFKRVKKLVLPDREEKAKEEILRNSDARKNNPRAPINKHHQNFLNRWWILSYPREELIAKIAKLNRYIVCSRVTKRPVFEFVDSSIRPGDSLQVFAFEDDYSFGILQSTMHWNWFTHKCSSMKADPRYTSESVFDTFPWPQKPTKTQIQAVADAALALRQTRQKLCKTNSTSFRRLYASLEQPGANPLRNAQATLDTAVLAAYSIKSGENELRFLLNLNLQLAALESKGKAIQGPGLPAGVTSKFLTKDCLTATILK